MFYQFKIINSIFSWFFITALVISFTSCKSYLNIEGTKKNLPKYILKYSQEDFAVIDSVMESLLSDINAVVLNQICLNSTGQEVTYLNSYLVGCVTAQNDSIILMNSIGEMENDMNNEEKWPVFEKLQDNITINKSFPYNMIKKFYVSINVHETIFKYQLKYENKRFDIVKY